LSICSRESKLIPNDVDQAFRLLQQLVAADESKSAIEHVAWMERWFCFIVSYARWCQRKSLKDDSCWLIINSMEGRADYSNGVFSKLLSLFRRLRRSWFYSGASEITYTVVHNFTFLFDVY